MRWHLKVIITVAVLVALQLVTLQAQEPVARLRWKNGDVLPGKLLESKAGQVHWTSPYFLDNLTISVDTLDSILFPKQSIPPTETFRVSTVSGDVWIADLIGADNNTFLFSSKRHGQVRVNRNVIYTLNQQRHPNLVFDGSNLQNWNLPQTGGIKDMTYKVYKMEQGQQDELWEKERFPDFSKLPPQKQGSFETGWLDPKLAEMEDNFSMVFEGRLDMNETGEYTFELASDDGSRLLIDGQPVVKARAGVTGKTKIKLTAGYHTLRVEYFEVGGTESLLAWWTGPDLVRIPLSRTKVENDWHQGLGDRPQTNRTKAKIFRALEWPKRFEINLELTSTESPRFVLALGNNLEEALRLETWGNELVLVQNTLFEPVLTIKKEQQKVHLQLALDSVSGVMQVFDFTGRLLVELNGVQLVEDDSGLYIHNRGQDLTVQHLRVYHQATRGAKQQVDPSRPRVYMINGQIIYGRLFIEDGNAYVLNDDQTQHNINLEQIDRIAHPDIKLATVNDTTEIFYTDGGIVRGQIQTLNSDQVTLQTAFSEKPVACALSGASILRLSSLTPEKRKNEQNQDKDKLFCVSGLLHGQLSFSASNSPLRWKFDGARKPVRLSDAVEARVERNRDLLANPTFDTKTFPELLHLKNQEIIPCKIKSYNKETLAFKSPFITIGKIDSGHVKGIKFANEMLGVGNKESFSIDDVKLDRALTIPRFNRDNPPSHILVAKTGDLMRGSLLGISGQAIQFESKLRTMNIPINRIAIAVNVSILKENLDNPRSHRLTSHKVRATLTDGSALVCEVLASKDGKLLGHSEIYGKMEIPITYIQHLTFGDFEKEKLESPFDEWIVHQSKEPEYSKKTSP